MSDILVLLWLIPGYVLVDFFLNKIVPKRNQSGWDFIARIGNWALILFVLATLVSTVIKRALPKSLIAFYAENFGRSHAIKVLPIGFALAFVLGIAAANWKFFRSLYWSYHQVDPYLQMAKQAKDKLGAYLLLSLKNGKVYVGQLVNATFDPNETSRMLVISIELSGFREKESHLVRFDKNYREHIQNPIDRSILIPFSEVVSISPFDFGVHQRFVESGITLLGQARNPI